MKKILIKAISLLLCSVLLIFSLASCSKYKEIEQTEEEKRVVMRVGGHDVTYDLFRAFFLVYYDDDFDYAAGKALESITSIFAVLDACEEMEIDTDGDEVYDGIDDMLEQAIEGEGGYKTYEAYLEELKKRNMNDFVGRLMLKYAVCGGMLESKYADETVDSSSVKAYFDSDECIKLTMLCTQSETVANAAYTALGEAETKEAALKIIIGKSIPIKDADKGWYYGRNEFNPVENPNAAEAIADLSANEFSKIVKDYEGDYYIYYCLEKNTEEFNEKYDSIEKSMKYNNMYKKLQQISASIMNEVEYLPLYNELKDKPSAIKMN